MKQSELKRLINRVRTLTRNISTLNQPSNPHVITSDFTQPRELKEWVMKNRKPIASQIMQSLGIHDAFVPALKDDNPSQAIFENLNDGIVGDFKISQKITPRMANGSLGVGYTLSGKAKVRFADLEGNAYIKADGTSPEIKSALRQIEKGLITAVGKDIESILAADGTFSKKNAPNDARVNLGTSFNFTGTKKTTLPAGFTVLVDIDATVTTIKENTKYRAGFGVRRQW